jgi:hypothetical protein
MTHWVDWDEFFEDVNEVDSAIGYLDSAAGFDQLLEAHVAVVQACLNLTNRAVGRPRQVVELDEVMPLVERANGNVTVHAKPAAAKARPAGSFSLVTTKG